MAGVIQMPVRLGRGQPLIPQMHGRAELLPEILGERLRLGRLGTLVTRHIQGIADHHLGHGIFPQYAADGLQVRATVRPMQRPQRLCRIPQRIRERQPDAPVPHIEGKHPRHGNRSGTLVLRRTFFHIVQSSRSPYTIPKGGRRRVMLRGTRVVLLLAFALALGVAYTVYAPFGPRSETFVDIPSGTGTAAIATRLEQAGIIRSRRAFELMRLLHGGTLHAGEYRFDHPLPIGGVYRRLVRGDVYTRGLSVPEGFNLFDIAAAVERAGLGSRDAFLAAARQHTELIADLAPHATSLEGFLFPATYRFSPRATPLQMLSAMTRRFRQASTQIGLHDNIARTVTMASLIEREVGVDGERPLVAGVFTNRLAKGMPLETDPAVIYAALLEGRYRGTIYRSDLQSPSPYNTYKHAGLPPGPICNPSLASLKAAMTPANTDLLYFVSDGAGHTRFSSTLAEHADQVTAYRAAVDLPPLPAPAPRTHKAIPPRNKRKRR